MNGTDNKKQRNQLIVLGGLGLLLVGVLVSQFSGGDAAPEPGETVDVAQAMDVEIEGSEAEAVVDEGVDNPVLSQALEYEKLSRDPFSAFWDTSETTDASAVVVELPKIRLDATMPGQGMPLAVVDGSMRFLGDSIQGWTVDHISDRAITLRAPSSDTYVVEMPILHGQISVPLDAMIVEAPESTITPLAENADLPEASPLGVLTPELPETESDADAPPSIESTDPTSDETGADF